MRSTTSNFATGIALLLVVASCGRPSEGTSLQGVTPDDSAADGGDAHEPEITSSADRAPGEQDEIPILPQSEDEWFTLFFPDPLDWEKYTDYVQSLEVDKLAAIEDCMKDRGLTLQEPVAITELPKAAPFTDDYVDENGLGITTEIDTVEIQIEAPERGPDPEELDVDDVADDVYEDALRGEEGCQNAAVERASSFSPAARAITESAANPAFLQELNKRIESDPQLAQMKAEVNDCLDRSGDFKFVDQDTAAQRLEEQAAEATDEQSLEATREIEVETAKVIWDCSGGRGGVEEGNDRVREIQAEVFGEYFSSFDLQF